jgi:tRNA/tmRNA/rRNA uracil-C5-methylase (TrmA/RlmC/RlmD family)
MEIGDYFKENKIVPKGLYDITLEYIQINKISDDDLYYNEYYQTNLDEFFECINFYPNRRLFEVISSAVKDFQDLFEPCCQSGIFGSYIAKNHPGTYKGIDINQLAIKKAKQRAKDNNLNESIFQQENVFQYGNIHEAIIGRHVINKKRTSINDEMLEKICNISKNIILVQTIYGNSSSKTVLESYQQAFNQHNFSFELLNQPLKIPETDSSSFVLKATQRL